MNATERRGLELAARHDGVVSRRQLIECGMTARTVDHRVETGRLLVVLPAVYSVAGAVIGVRSHARAAALWGGDGAAVSHTTAAFLFGFDCIPAPSESHVTVPPSRQKRTAGVSLHRSPIEPIDRRYVDGIPLTAPARTLIDCAALLEQDALESALQSACNRGLVTTAHVVDRLDHLGSRGRMGAARLRRLLEIHTGEAPLASRLEVLVARTLRAGGLPPPRRQWPVAIRGRRYRLDFAWPESRVALEADGYRVHGTRQGWRRDIQRLADLARDGWLVEHTDWEEVTQHPDALVTRIGTSLDMRGRSDRFGA